MSGLGRLERDLAPDHPAVDEFRRHELAGSLVSSPVGDRGAGLAFLDVIRHGVEVDLPEAGDRGVVDRLLGHASDVGHDLGRREILTGGISACGSFHLGET